MGLPVAKPSSPTSGSSTRTRSSARTSSSTKPRSSTRTSASSTTRTPDGPCSSTRSGSSATSAHHGGRGHAFRQRARSRGTGRGVPLTPGGRPHGRGRPLGQRATRNSNQTASAIPEVRARKTRTNHGLPNLQQASTVQATTSQATTPRKSAINLERRHSPASSAHPGQKQGTSDSGRTTVDESNAIQHQDRRGPYKTVLTNQEIQEKLRKPRQNVFVLTNWKKHAHWIALLAYLFTTLGLIHPADSQHVVFEDIGKFAGATSYIHVSFHLNLADLYTPIQIFRQHIEKAKKSMLNYDTGAHQVAGYTPQPVLLDLMQKHKEAHTYILDRASMVAV